MPLHGPDLRTSQPGLFVAGNVTGIEGASVAQAQGVLAGTAVASEMGAYAEPDARLREALKHVQRTRADAPLTFLPTIEAGRDRLAQLWRLRVASPATGARHAAQ